MQCESHIHLNYCPRWPGRLRAALLQVISLSLNWSLTCCLWKTLHNQARLHAKCSRTLYCRIWRCREWQKRISISSWRLTQPSPTKTLSSVMIWRLFLRVRGTKQHNSSLSNKPPNKTWQHMELLPSSKLCARTPVVSAWVRALSAPSRTPSTAPQHSEYELHFYYTHINPWSRK